MAKYANFKELATALFKSPQDRNAILRDFAEDITIPQEVENQFAGHAGKVQYAILREYLPKLFNVDRYAAFAAENAVVLFDQADADRHEIPLVRRNGIPVAIAKQDEVSVTIGGDNFDIREITPRNLNAILVCLGAKSGGKGAGNFRLHGVRIMVDQDGKSVTFNGTQVTRPSIMVYGSNVTFLDPIQSGFMVIMCALAMHWSCQGVSFQTKFRRAVTKCAAFCENKTVVGHQDRPCAFFETARRNPVGMMVGLNGPKVADRQDIRAMYEAVSQEQPMIAHPQGKALYALNALTELGGTGETVFIASIDPAKYLKRLLLGGGRQMGLETGLSRGSVTYKGMADEGVLMDITLAPSLLPLFTGGPGAILANRSWQEMGDILPQVVEHKLVGTSYGIKTAEDLDSLRDSLPKVGEFLLGTIQPYGCPLPVSVPKRLQFAKVVSVSEPQVDDFGNAFWVIRVQRIDRTGQAKLRGSVKGTLTYTEFRVDSTTLHSVGLAIHGGTATGQAIAGSDASKAFGSGNARGGVTIAVQTIRKALKDKADTILRDLLPAEAFDEDGNVRFSEKISANGGYAKLYEYLKDNFSKVLSFERIIPESLYRKLHADYVRKYGEGTRFNVGQNVLGHQDLIEFYQKDGKFVICQTTAVLEVCDLVKVESPTISQAVSKTGSMLEIASFAKAIGLHHTSAMLRRGGRKNLRSVVKTLSNLSYEVKEADVLTFGDINPEQLRQIAQTPIPEWDAKQNIVFRAATGLFAVNKDVLLALVNSGDSEHVLATVQSIMAYAAEGDTEQVASTSNALAATLASVITSLEFFKRLSRGADAITAKRMAVIVPYDAHDTVFLNSKGEPAEILAEMFGVEVGELDGKMTLGYRAPMFMAVPLKIKLVDWMPEDMIGVSDEVASFDEGDFDGDGYYLIPVTSRKAIEELRKFDARAWKEKIYRACIGNRELLEEHWVETNRWASKPWATSVERSIKDVVELCQEAMEHQIIQMPSDGNRSDFALAISTMVETHGFVTPELAAGMKFYVFETQLAGFSKKWWKAHRMAPTDLDGPEVTAKFIDYAVTELGLTRELANLWLYTRKGHAAYTSKKTFKVDKRGICVLRTENPNPRNLAMALVAGAMKKLAQGEQTPASREGLLPSIGKIDVVGKTGVTITLWDIVQELARKGVPAAVQIRHSIEKVQPLAQRIKYSSVDEE